MEGYHDLMGLEVLQRDKGLCGLTSLLLPE